MAEQLEQLAGMNNVVIPDLWQQEAVTALRQGRDVVVHAPTGAGKTLIFELWSNHGKNRGQAIYTVPTRALANDKLAEWRSKGWNVGIATGDLSENLDAPVIVATLETQKNRLLRGDGPTLLVVDEYQMLADQDRGLNYELAIAMAPAQTQLLLLSGSVANPHDMVKWLTRLGRDAVLVRTDHRPVPLEEIHSAHFNRPVPPQIRGYWPRVVTQALCEDLGPILIFAPRRLEAETLARELARQLPNPNPLTLTDEQRLIVGEEFSALLKSRVAYHHSGLSYGARAGVVEPLAKAGQLRVVVATMGLAAGINFSLRSVALAGDSYRKEKAEFPLRADEILQMFGRAGRRGLDERGYVVVTQNQLRMMDAHAAYLTRTKLVDWNALLGVMAAAADAGLDPFREAVRIQQRLFTLKPILLGVEESLKNPEVPCGLGTDPERARHIRKRIPQILNSAGFWENQPEGGSTPMAEVRVQVFGVPEREPWARLPAKGPGKSLDPLAGVGKTEFPTPWEKQPPAFTLHPLLAQPEALKRVAAGPWIAIAHAEDGSRLLGRELPIAEHIGADRVQLAKPARRLLGWREGPVSVERWEKEVRNRVVEALAKEGRVVVRLRQEGRTIAADIDAGQETARALKDSLGIPLWNPPVREVSPPECGSCALKAECRALSPSAGAAMLWRRLRLIDPQGRPTRRGRIVSFFSQGDGLAIAAALEDESYELDDLVFDLANLDGGFRFAGEENRWGGRLANACHGVYGLLTVPGYLENGVPPEYGSGADAVVAAVRKDPASKYRWVTPVLGIGDIDRVIIEWRSTLRQVLHAPMLEWPRWAALQEKAKLILNETRSPTLTKLPQLDFQQTRRVEHQLQLRR
jgi:superfamily II DNA/RNA helicase